MNKTTNHFLLPYSWRYLGWLLLATGTVLAIFYLWFDFRLKMPVFAFVSSFLTTKYLATFRTNIADELILLTLLCGFFMLVFSKEKGNQQPFDHLKGKALFRALFYNTILLFISILFLYGQAFLAILVLNVFSLFIFYLVFLKIMIIKERKGKQQIIHNPE